MLQFVTRAVRIIDLMTNMCTQSFENHNGLKVFIERLDVSVWCGGQFVKNYHFNDYILWEYNITDSAFVINICLFVVSFYL